MFDCRVSSFRFPVSRLLLCCGALLLVSRAAVAQDCCAPHAGTGCGDATCEACVCSQDPFCCVTLWDGICAGEAGDWCVVCGGMPPEACASGGDPACPSPGGCCEEHGPGCEDADCCNAVCALDPFCCDVEWDGICVGEAQAICGCTPPSACPGAGDCCVENGTPGCEDEDCCNTVCAVDPFCCDLSWDSICAGEAQALCGDVCAVCGNGMVEGNEECDDGNLDNGDACTDTCQNAECGDGRVWTGIEQCDDGNASNNDACLNDCTNNVCGDGFLNPAAEDCDDGNNTSGDGCSATCEHEAALSLDLIDPQPCYAEGTQFCVQLNMDLQQRDPPGMDQIATGFTAFIEYDETVLTYLPGASSYNDANPPCGDPAHPFPLHIQPIATSEVAPGEINLDGSSQFPGICPPEDDSTSDDATLATVCFSVNAGNSGVMTNIGFRLVNQIPPFSRVSFQGVPEPTNLFESDSITIDNEPPTIMCPPNLSGSEFQCDDDVPAAAMNAAQFTMQGGTVSDNCGPPRTVMHVGDSSMGECPKVVTRTYKATDSAGNMATCEQTITLQDLVAPVVTEVPPTQTVQCGSVPPPFANHGQFTAAGGELTENCDPNLLTFNLNQELMSGNSCPSDPKLIVRFYTVCDSCDNCDPFKHVIVVSDTMPPDIDCPDDSDLQCVDDVPPAATNLAEFQAAGGTASDNCSAVTVVLDSESDNGGTGCPASPLIITRVYKATDACGNMSTCEHVIIVSDTMAPTVTVPADITVNADAGGCTAVVTFSASATDNCDDSVSTTCTPASGSTFDAGTTTVTCMATDDCGNTGSSMFDVTVEDQNTVTATVVLEGVDASMGAITRCIKFRGKFALPGPSNCCEAHGGLGCDDAACEAAVCGLDPFCCDVAWDSICAGEAEDFCGGLCAGGGGDSDCCFSHPSAGCDDDACEACVCALDPFCCNVAWDSICAGEADVECDASCPMPCGSVAPPPPRPGECASDVSVLVTFMGNPATGTATFDVPCGNYGSMCAKDEQHTLWDSQGMTDLGATWQVAAPLFLRAGDNDNDGDVDINDVTLLIFQFGGPEPAGGCPFNPLNRGSDYSNNGNVGSEDYSLLSLNWLTQSSCLCSAPASGAPELPTRVETRFLLPGVAAQADLDRNGVVDVKDVELFEQAHGLPPHVSTRLREIESSANVGELPIGSGGGR